MNGYIAYLEEKIKELQAEEELLIAGGRKDEANFVRIKSNICDIGKTVYNVHAKTKQGAALREEYRKQLDRFETGWGASLEKAREFGDVEKVVIEEAKLEMLQMLRAKFEELEAGE